MTGVKNREPIENAAASPKADSSEEFVHLLYDELRTIARREYHHGGQPMTLQPTALIGEVYIKMQKRAAFTSEAHFLGCAATAMRNVMIDAARARLAGKRGGGNANVSIDLAALPAPPAKDEELVRLSTALTDLAQHDPQLAKLVEYRFFVGLDEQETARVMNVSDRTVRRWWTRARAWIHSEMTDTAQDQ